MKKFLTVFRELKIQRDGYCYSSALSDVENKLSSQIRPPGERMYSYRYCLSGAREIPNQGSTNHLIPSQ